MWRGVIRLVEQVGCQVPGYLILLGIGIRRKRKRKVWKKGKKGIIGARARAGSKSILLKMSLKTEYIYMGERSMSKGKQRKGNSMVSGYRSVGMEGRMAVGTRPTVCRSENRSHGSVAWTWME